MNAPVDGPRLGGRAERFALDRLVVDDDLPLRCEVEWVREALGRFAQFGG